MSNPDAHACAACSADARSLKFINAQRVLATNTTDLMEVAGIPGIEDTTVVRKDCSVVDDGRDDINNEV